MLGEGDRRDRQDATRLFVAAALALILLVAIGAGSIYYFTEMMGSSDPFSEGLGLKNAALISFAVSFVAAWAAVRSFVALLGRHTLVPFAW